MSSDDVSYETGAESVEDDSLSEPVEAVEEVVVVVEVAPVKLPDAPKVVHLRNRADVKKNNRLKQAAKRK